jgi:phosphoribosyl 1,2-cyclic phosphodiesterase
VTDLGHATKLVIERVRPANVLLLEANHDVRLLQEDTKRPWPVKQRILSRHGHLSNEAAGDFAKEVASAHLQRLYLAHLSRDCNLPELACRVVGGRLQEVGAVHIQLETAAQDVVSPTLAL